MPRVRVKCGSGFTQQSSSNLEQGVTKIKISSKHLGRSDFFLLKLLQIVNPAYKLQFKIMFLVWIQLCYSCGVYVCSLVFPLCFGLPTSTYTAQNI